LLNKISTKSTVREVPPGVEHIDLTSTNETSEEKPVRRFWRDCLPLTRASYAQQADSLGENPAAITERQAIVTTETQVRLSHGLKRCAVAVICDH
jgi:hypothetical protein